MSRSLSPSCAPANFPAAVLSELEGTGTRSSASMTTGDWSASACSNHGHPMQTPQPRASDGRERPAASGARHDPDSDVGHPGLTRDRPQRHHRLALVYGSAATAPADKPFRPLRRARSTLKAWLTLVTGLRRVYSRGRHGRAAAQSDAVGGEPESLGRVSRCSGCTVLKCDGEPVS